MSGYFECYETSITYAIQLPYGGILIACFEKSLALGTWAVIHFPSQSEMFLLILLALQPCKIPCFNSLFMIYYSISSLAVQWCLVTTLWCSNHILQPFSVLSNPLILIRLFQIICTNRLFPYFWDCFFLFHVLFHLACDCRDLSFNNFSGDMPSSLSSLSNLSSLWVFYGATFILENLVAYLYAIYF